MCKNKILFGIIVIFLFVTKCTSPGYELTGITHRVHVLWSILKHLICHYQLKILKRKKNLDELVCDFLHNNKTHTEILIQVTKY